MSKSYVVITVGVDRSDGGHSVINSKRFSFPDHYDAAAAFNAILRFMYRRDAYAPHPR